MVLTSIAMGVDGVYFSTTSQVALLTDLIRLAMERTSSFIKIWFWSRSATNVPSDVLNGSGSVNTGNWVIHRFLTSGESKLI